MDRRKWGRLKQLFQIIIAAIIGFLFGIVIMALASRRLKEGTRDTSDLIQNLISAENIRNNLREMTKKPHVAGTEEDWNTANNLKEQWLSQGLDSAKLVSYDVLLQYPPLEKGKENRVQIVDSDGGDPIFESTLRPDTFGEKDIEQDGILPPYHAYSGSGDVMGEPVYVNYGSLSDLEYLRTNLTPGINFTGKVFICRKGVFRVAEIAESVNAAAVILFPDPQDFSVPWNKGSPYPHGPYLPKSAPVWGSLYTDIGDPLTPGYPSTDGAFRIPLSETKLLSIPVHPIGFGDAQKILSYMTGPAPPASWRGGLNVSYQVGPGFKDGMKQRKIRVVVNSTLQQRTTYNVIGAIRGRVEPDRYVIIGNHRDAWGLGAVDPTGGTAVLMEISRVFGKLNGEGWRPRRTILFASWGAEEFTLTGSVEWTEQFHDILTKRTLAYLNLDIAVTGKYVVLPQSTPFVAKVLEQSLKKVKEPYPSDTRKTLYDTAKERLNEDLPNSPVVRLVDGGTDFEGFLYGLGIASVNVFYLLDFTRVENHPQFYSLYHTQYETFRLVDEYIDEGFLCHRAIGQLYAEVLRNLGDSVIIPADMADYVGTISSLSHNFRNQYVEKIIGNVYRNISLDYLLGAIDEFALAVDYFQHTILPAVDTDDPLAVRAINDQMMYLEQAFLSRERLPGKAVNRHALVASSVVSGNMRTFPGLTIALDGIDDDPNQEKRWEEVERQLSIVTHVMRSATSILRDFTSW